MNTNNSLIVPKSMQKGLTNHYHKRPFENGNSFTGKQSGTHQKPKASFESAFG